MKKIEVDIGRMRIKKAGRKEEVKVMDRIKVIERAWEIRVRQERRKNVIIKEIKGKESNTETGVKEIWKELGVALK